MIKKYIAEIIGTFSLAGVVLFGSSFAGSLPFSIPVMAALALALSVYTIGSISGSHINPAVTIGLFSVKKISLVNAIGYIISQFIGAGLAMLAATLVFHITGGISVGPFSATAFIAETLGAFFFCFGIAAVVYGKISDTASGLVISGSLLLGILLASLTGSAGILNPAVAFAVGGMTLVYLLAPILGSVIGMQVYRAIK